MIYPYTFIIWFTTQDLCIIIECGEVSYPLHKVIHDTRLDEEPSEDLSISPAQGHCMGNTTVLVNILMESRLTEMG